MSPEEANFLHLFGKGFMGNFILFTVATIGYAFYLLLMPVSARILLIKPSHSRMSIAMLVLLIIIFLVTSFYWASYVVDLITLLRVVLVQLPGRELVDQLVEVRERNAWILKYQEWPLNINFVICDAIVVWRVHVIVSKRPATVTTFVLLLIDIGLSLAWGIGQTVSPEPFSANVAGQINVPAILKVMSWTASLLTNAVATGLIAYQAWIHRLLLDQGHMRGQSTPVSRALALLVESGAVFMALQVIVIALNSLSYETLSAPEIFMRSMNQVGIMLTAIYPTLIIIIVDRERSIAQATNSRFLTELTMGSFFPNEGSTTMSRSESDGLRSSFNKPLPHEPAPETAKYPPDMAC